MTKPYLRPTAAGALPGGLVRTRYFDGMLLTQRDLDDDQRYWLEKRRLTNRALGHGVVWGLRLEHDQQKASFVLHEGYGLDCCGRDLVVTCPTRIPARDLIDEHPLVQQLLALAKAPHAGQAPPTGGGGEPGGEFRPNYDCEGGRDRQERTVRAALMLEYLECPSAPRDVVRDACGSNMREACEYSRIIETSRLVLRPLPPPEPGPIELILAEIGRLQQAVPDLFPQLGAELGVGVPPMSLTVRELHGESVVAEHELILARDNASPGAWVAETTLELSGQASTTLAFELRPALGWLFCEGAVELVLDEQQGEEGMNARELVTIEGPHALHLAWVWRLEGGGEDQADFALRDWVLSPLFRNTTRSGGSRSTISVGPDPQGDPEGVTTIRWTIDPDAAASLPPAPEPTERCFDLLGIDAARNRLGLTLLAGLATWLWDQLHTRDPGGDVGPELTGPRALATWIYMIAWRTLFGAHAAAPGLDELTRGRLGDLLHRLLRMWCEGMTYRGPRCGCVHGIVLGTIDVDACGQLSNFDPWQCRRHVITGPLLNHWLGQFGVEPLDVIAARIARTICCVSSLPLRTGVGLPLALPRLPEASLSHVDSGTGLVNAQTFGNQAVMVSDGCYLAFGERQEVVERLEALGVNLVSQEVVGRGRFLMLMLAGLQGRPSQVGQRYALWSLDGDEGVTAQLVVAVSDGGTGES